MTRNDYNSVAASIDPLRENRAWPLRFSDMTQNVELLASDSISSTQESLANEAEIVARKTNSPLMVPEYPSGVIADAVS